jgi:hypothetical protein
MIYSLLIQKLHVCRLQMQSTEAQDQGSGDGKILDALRRRLRNLHSLGGGNKIFIQMHSGRRIITLDDLELTETIPSIKAMIENETGIPTSRQRLVFGSEEQTLSDDHTLADYNIQNESTVRLIDCRLLTTHLAVRRGPSRPSPGREVTPSLPSVVFRCSNSSFW